MSADFWTDYLGNGLALGDTLRVDGVDRIVVGVMPEGLRFPFDHDLWTMIEPAAADAVETVARIRPGSNPELAAADAGRILESLWLERGDRLVVHAALGAAPAQVASQMFWEALLISVAGAAVGLGLSALAIDYIEATLSGHWGYYWMAVRFEPGVVTFTLSLAVRSAQQVGAPIALDPAPCDTRQDALPQQRLEGGGVARRGPAPPNPGDHGHLRSTSMFGGFADRRRLEVDQQRRLGAACLEKLQGRFEDGMLARGVVGDIQRVAVRERHEQSARRLYALGNDA